MEESYETSPIYMSQEYLYHMLRRLAKENNEWCEHWVDQDILDVLRLWDKEEKTDLATRYINQCHHPELNIGREGQCYISCPECEEEISGDFSKTEKAIEERLIEAKKQLSDSEQ